MGCAGVKDCGRVLSEVNACPGFWGGASLHVFTKHAKLASYPGGAEKERLIMALTTAAVISHL
jgi:hypothetical protein